MWRREEKRQDATKDNGRNESERGCMALNFGFLSKSACDFKEEQKEEKMWRRE